MTPEEIKKIKELKDRIVKSPKIVKK